MSIKKLIFFAFFIIISSCNPTPEIYTPQHFSKGIEFDVVRVEFIDNYISAGGNYAEEQFPYSLSNAVKDWINDKIIPRGNNNRIMRLTLIEASVIEKQLPLTTGIKSLILTEFSEEYIGKYHLKLEIIEPGEFAPIAEMEITVNRNEKVEENTSLSKLRGIFYEMTQEMIKEVDYIFDENYMKYFSKYILY